MKLLEEVTRHRDKSTRADAVTSADLTAGRYTCEVQHHLGLRGLSREHHQALTLARLLRTAVGPGTDRSLARLALIARVKETWGAHVAPHFAVEERELLPLSLGGPANLRAHAAVIRDDHAALRAGLAALNETSPDAVALGARLETHVRFEERTWFPALEAHLDEDTLASLSWRLEVVPRVPIIGFRPDLDEPVGSWIASLACGHGQHVRHRPPFQDAAWLMRDEGRAAKLGTRLACQLCRMPRVPPQAECYKETPIFDESSVPAGLLASHTLRAGTWGQIVVLAGKLDYVIEETPAVAFVLRPGVDGMVAPEQPHHVKPHAHARFHVRFLKVPAIVAG